MKIAFRTIDLRSLCEKQTLSEAKLGIVAAKYLRARLEDIRSAQTLSELIAGSPQEMENGDIQIRIGRKHRILVASNHSKRPSSIDGKLDWSKVKRIQILEIEELYG